MSNKQPYNDREFVIRRPEDCTDGFSKTLSLISGQLLAVINYAANVCIRHDVQEQEMSDLLISASASLLFNIIKSRKEEAYGAKICDELSRGFKEFVALNKENADD